MGVDRTLPREEFFYRQLVSSADFLKAYHASAHSIDDYGLRRGTQRFVPEGGKSIALNAIPPSAKLYNCLLSSMDVP